ncbi:sensor histidine kinase [Sediminitomix flava]|uniref:histidine kinase n=1 Tax=Sediminitomix flava TaxID=379075 RepID=A0A315ZHM2_SEDFL|nr:HAMP domain-containing sensor histidine kinase [Sediminitomix flava]PWJ44204.1 phospho-acceptor domain-containing protein [Sediminitomix flava]
MKPIISLPKYFSSAFLLGDKDNFSFKERVINCTFFCGSIATSTLYITGIQTFTPLFSIIIISSIILGFIGYLTTRIYRRYLVSLLILIVLELIIIVMLWKEKGGVLGLVPITFIGIVVIDIHLIPKKYNPLFIITSVLLFSAVIFAEVKFSELQIEVSSTIEEKIALASINWGAIMLIILAIIVLFKNEYDKAQNILHEQKEELKQMLQKEQERHQMKGAFLAMVSHQFRTPMTVIQSSTNLIQLRASKSFQGSELDKTSRQFENIYGAIDTLTNIMERMLNYESIQANNVNFNPKMLELQSFIQKIINNYPTTKKTQKIDLTYTGTARQIQADPILMEHCISNLISNAVKYDPQHRFPNINICFTKDNVQISISDKGLGIPEEQQKELFSPFFRAKNVANIKGTGVGLFVVKNFIELHDGQITVKSKEGEGTTFKLSLPFKKNNLKVEAPSI